MWGRIFGGRSEYGVGRLDRLGVATVSGEEVFKGGSIEIKFEVGEHLRLRQLSKLSLEHSEKPELNIRLSLNPQFTIR